MRYLGIETYNPAEITYPADVKKVLIVNNAVPQPADSGYDYLLLGLLQDTCRAYADSALFEATKALGSALFETDFFQDVLLFHENTRTDDAFLEDKKLTQDEVRSLCDETGADAIISFDRLLFNMVKMVSNYADGFLFGVIDVNIHGVLRSYLPSREMPQVSILVTDSIYWAEEAPNLAVLDKMLPTADEALRTAADYIGQKVHTVFVPHWGRDTRWFYTGFGTQWKKATSYAANEKWDVAFEQWSKIHANSSGWKTKAKTAANIALYYELSEEMDKALEWATKSFELFEKNAGGEDKSTQNQAAYKDNLQKRINNNKKLKLQIGDE